jgi:hypothetical protein
MNDMVFQDAFFDHDISSFLHGNADPSAPAPAEEEATEAQEIDDFLSFFEMLEQDSLVPEMQPSFGASASASSPAERPFQLPTIPLPNSLAASIPVIGAAAMPFAPARADAAAKRVYRKKSIAKWLEKRATRHWKKGPSYSKRSEVAVRRPRDNGKFVKSNVRFVTMNELEQSLG